MTHPEQQQPSPYWPPQPSPAQPYAGQPQQAPPPAKRPPTRLDFWLKGPGIIVVIVVGGILLYGLYAAFGSGGQPAKVSAEARVVSCEIDSSGSLPQAKVGLTVRNTGDKTRSFTVSIEYRDSAGSRIDTDTAYVRSIAPGDTARTEETTLLDASVSSGGTCAIVGVR